MTQLQWRGTGPVDALPAAVKDEVAKLEFLRRMTLTPWSYRYCQVHCHHPPSPADIVNVFILIPPELAHLSQDDHRTARRP
jgi:hypothetical protein